ncbi:hypothetical protein VNO77_23247 [Canavalia gladiata]|uniref:Uncharacterized protein n=1 Tax=Canavalia gladiata TaxID=3824 RepID=A0AAN9L4Y4_CANGL
MRTPLLDKHPTHVWSPMKIRLTCTQMTIRLSEQLCTLGRSTILKEKLANKRGTKCIHKQDPGRRGRAIRVLKYHAKRMHVGFPSWLERLRPYEGGRVRVPHMAVF